MEFFTDEQIGEIVKSARVLRGYTQAELGERLGVQAAAVQKWESGKVKNIKRDKLRQLAIELRINPAVLIGLPMESTFTPKEFSKAERETVKEFMSRMMKERG